MSRHIYIFSPSSAVRDKPAFRRGLARLRALGAEVEVDTAALASHLRSVHCVRCLQRFYATPNGKCLECGTELKSRLKLLAHRCDVRRTRRWVAVQGRPELRLPTSTVAELDSAYTNARKSSRRAGHSHVIAVGAAARADGRQVGRAIR